MTRTARVSSDAARYYRSNQGKAAFIALTLAIVGVLTGKKPPIVAAIGSFFGLILPRNVLAVWRLGEQQEATNEKLAESSTLRQERLSESDLDRLRQFETDVIVARAQDLTRLEAIESRLDRLEANQ